MTKLELSRILLYATRITALLVAILFSDRGAGSFRSYADVFMAAKVFLSYIEGNDNP